MTQAHERLLRSIRKDIRRKSELVDIYETCANEATDPDRKRYWEAWRHTMIESIERDQELLTMLTYR